MHFPRALARNEIQTASPKISTWLAFLTLVSLIDSLIYFNGMSTRLELFHASRFGNRVHCTYIFPFLCSCFLRAFFEHEWFLKRFIRLIYVILTGTATPGEVDPEAMTIKWFSTLLRSLELEPHLQFNDTYFRREYSQYNLSVDNRMLKNPADFYIIFRLKLTASSPARMMIPKIYLLYIH